MSQDPNQDPNSDHSNNPPPMAELANPYTENNPSTPMSSGTTSAGKIILIILLTAGGVMLVCGGVAVALLIPAVNAARVAAQTQIRANQLKQVGLGIHNYHDSHGQLPMTVTANESGQPLFGWRLAIAPFVEGQVQWEQFQTDKSWDSPENQPIANQAVPAFQASEGQPGLTSIFAISDPRGMFPSEPNTPVSFRDIPDGISNTVMAVYLPNRTTAWSSTDSLTVDEVYTALQELEPSMRAHLLLGDASVRMVDENLTLETLDAMVTIAGGESINDFQMGY